MNRSAASPFAAGSSEATPLYAAMAGKANLLREARSLGGNLLPVVYNGFHLSHLPSHLGLNLPGGLGHLSTGQLRLNRRLAMRRRAIVN